MNKIKQFLWAQNDTSAQNNGSGFRVFSLKRLHIAVVIGLILTIIVGQFSVFASDCKQIRANTLRLHIVASSNQKADQEIKLKVRDKILQEHGELFLNAANITDAKAIVKSSLPLIAATANSVVDGCKVAITSEFFDTRVYEDFTLPAGNYDAVRITIGEARGKNWWCVLYPALCLPAAAKAEKLDVLPESQAEIIKNQKKYKVAFLSVELFEKMKNMLKGTD